MSSENGAKKLAEAQAHIRRAWEAGITVGVNPPGLLRTAVELADQRTPEANQAAAVFAAEALRHLLHGTDVEFIVRAASLSEELQQRAAKG